MNGGSDPYKQYQNENFQMFIRKLLEQIQISCSGQHKIAKKCTFLDNLRIINQERSMEARQMTPFFLIYFSPSNCKIHFCIWKWSKSIFGPAIILFQKLDTPRLLKIHLMFCPPRGAKKGISSWTMRVPYLAERLGSSYVLFSVK